MEHLIERRPEFCRSKPADILRLLHQPAGARDAGGNPGPGNHRVRRLIGAGFDIADFRPYAAGDDTRFLDWSALARLDRPIIRLFQGLKDNPQVVAVDASASMALGSPTKFSAACWSSMDRMLRAVSAGDPAGLEIYRGNERKVVHPLRRLFSASQLLDVIGMLMKTVPGGRCTFSDQFRFLAAHCPSHAELTWISDFLPEAPAMSAASRKRPVNLIWILAAMEKNPEKALGSRLYDVETGKISFSRGDADGRAFYRRARQKHEVALEELAHFTGGFAQCIEV